MTSNVIPLHKNVNKERKANENKEINLERAWQDPLGPLGKQNLIERGNWYELPNPIWFQLHCMIDSRTRLFDYISRMTLGFWSKKTKMYRVAMPWPGHGKIAELLGVSSADNVSTLRRQLQRSGMIIVWKDKDTKQEWVGVNPVLFHIPPIVTRFLGKYCGKYDYENPNWVRKVRDDYSTEGFKILKSTLYDLKGYILRCYRLPFKSLKVDKKGQLFTFSKDSKVPKPEKSLNDIFKRYLLNDRSNDSDRSSGKQEKKQGKSKGQDKSKGQSVPQKFPASDKGGADEGEKSLQSDKESLGGAEAEVDELVKYLFAAHKKHCKSGGKWLTPDYKVEISKRDKEQGFPKAAVSLLTRLSGLKYPLEKLADRYVEFVVKTGCERGWPNPPHGGNYCESLYIDDFFRTDETILEAQKSEKRKAERERKQKQEEEWKNEQKEIERKEKEELERIKEVFETGERPCFGKCGRYDLCEECKEKTEEKWYECRLKSAGGKR